jgi:hypothetical protein
LSFQTGVPKAGIATKKTPLHPPGRQGSSTLETKSVLKTPVRNFSSLVSGSLLLAAPIVRTPMLPPPVMVAAGKASAVAPSEETHLCSSVELMKSAPPIADPPLPPGMTTSPTKVVTVDPRRELPNVRSDVDEDKNHLQCPSEVATISV